MSRFHLSVENVSGARSPFVYDAFVRPEQQTGRCDCSEPLRRPAVTALVGPGGVSLASGPTELDDLCYGCARSISGETRFLAVEIVDPQSAPGHVFRVKCDSELDPGCIYDLGGVLPAQLNPTGLFWRTPHAIRGRFRLREFAAEGVTLIERPGLI